MPTFRPEAVIFRSTGEKAFFHALASTYGCELLETRPAKGGPLGRRPFFRPGFSKVMSWAQQREAIRIAAEAGVRARTSAAGSETLPLTHHHLRYAMLSRPNGELTRAGQYYYQLIDRPPPSRQYDRNQPLIREGPNDYIMLRGGAKKLLRSLQPNGNYHLTKLGKSFFKDKWVDWVVHVPVIIRGIRRNGRNRGMPYERTKRLPVTDLNVTLPRQISAQAARNLKASALAQLGNPEPNDIIWELSDETYYLDATREWTFSQQAMQVVDDRVVVETVLDQPLGALRDVSYQLYCGDEILESAFEQRPDKLCVPRQLAELMRLPLQEVLSDFDAICTKKTWREQGITPREIREFCLWRQAPMFYVDCQGRLLDKYEPTVKEQRAVAFTSWNGHAFFSNPPAPSRSASRSGSGPGTGARGSQAKRPSSRIGGSGRARSPAVISTLKTWSRSGGSSWPRGTARRWSCEA